MTIGYLVQLSKLKKPQKQNNIWYSLLLWCCLFLSRSMSIHYREVFVVKCSLYTSFLAILLLCSFILHLSLALFRHFQEFCRFMRVFLLVLCFKLFHSWPNALSIGVGATVSLEDEARASRFGDRTLLKGYRQIACLCFFPPLFSR